MAEDQGSVPQPTGGTTRSAGSRWAGRALDVGVRVGGLAIAIKLLQNMMVHYFPF